MVNKICNKNKVAQNAYNWSDYNPLSVSRASAQQSDYTSNTVNVYDSSKDIAIKSSQAILPMPILFLIFIFTLFIIVISIVYTYHWTQFNLGDSFIKRATFIYFMGLVLLTLPLLLFLI
jgi:hypothetical protein